MYYAEFTAAVADQIKGYLPEEYKDADVRLSEVLKNNDTKLVGLTVTKGGQNIAPNIYLEGYYSRMEDEDIPFEDVMEEIAQARIKNDVGDIFDVSNITDYTKIEKKILPRLINKELNDEVLKGLPYLSFAGDLAEIFYVELGKDPDKGVMSVKITNELADQWGVTCDDLDRIARKNIAGKSYFKSMKDTLIEMMGGSLPDYMEIPENDGPEMYILSNEEKVNGASSLLDKEILSDISERLGGDFTILPSSIHEVIILPSSGTEDDENLRTIVCDVNDTQVLPEEKLSDNIYRYDAADKRVVLVA